MLKFSRSIFVASCLVLSGCKFHVAPDVYLSDLERLEEEFSLPTTITLSVPVILEENCEKHREDISAALSAGFSNLRYRGCEEIGSDDYAVFQADTVVARYMHAINYAKFARNQPAIFLFAIREGANERVYAGTNELRLSAMREALAQQGSSYSDEFRRLDMKLIVNIINDTRDQHIIETDGTFYNGDAVYWRRSFNLDFRQSATVAVSDVANAAFKRGDGVVLFSLLNIEEIPEAEKTPSQLQEALPEE